MSFQKVEAGRSVEWLKQGIGLVFKNPVAFLVMALIIAIISIVPILGALALLIIGPALFAGLVYAAREEDQGRKAEIGQLFRGFQEPGKIGPLLALCIPGIVLVVVMIVLGFIFVGGALMGGGLAAAGNSSAGVAAALGGGMLMFMLVMLVVAFFYYAVLVFAVPRVMFDGIEPFAAMKESLSASMANIGALLLFAVILFVIVMVAGFILVFIPILGPLLLGLFLNALLGCVCYLMYRDVFGGGGGAVADMPPAPPV